MTHQHGTIHWTELASGDPEAAAAFHARLMGWEIQRNPMGDEMPYWVMMQGEAPVCGIFAKTEEMAGLPDHWMTYVAVDDVDATAAEAEAAGGAVIRAPFDVPGVGRIAMIADPGGAVLGVMTPA